MNFSEGIAWFLVILNINSSNHSAWCDFCLPYHVVSIQRTINIHSNADSQCG